MGSPKRQLISGTGSRTNAYTDFHHTVFFAACPTQTPDQFWYAILFPIICIFICYNKQLSLSLTVPSDQEERYLILAAQRFFFSVHSINVWLLLMSTVQEKTQASYGIRCFIGRHDNQVCYQLSIFYMSIMKAAVTLVTSSWWLNLQGQLFRISEVSTAHRPLPVIECIMIYGDSNLLNGAQFVELCIG